VSDIKAVQNNASFGQPLPQQQKSAAPAEPVPETPAASTWDGVERRKKSSDRRASRDNRPEFLETRHRRDRRRRRSVSVKV